MPDFVDFVPLYVRTEEEIRSDMDVDVNAGLSPTDPTWVDTRAGQFFHMVTQPFVIEAARIHDYVSTIMAVAFVQFAYGDYLDYHAASFNTERIAAVSASGKAVFSGSVGTLVPTGTNISPIQTDSNVVPPTFSTQETKTIRGPLTTPTGVTIGHSNTGGHLPAGSHYYKVAAKDGAGETLASTEVSATISGAGEGIIALNWAPVLVEGEPAPIYVIYRGNLAGTEDESIEVTSPGFEDNGRGAWTYGNEPKFSNTTGGKVAVTVLALEPGAAGDVGAGALTQILNPTPGMIGVTNPLPMLSGADAENDQALQTRLLLNYEGQGPGTQADYRRWSLSYPGVGKVNVLPLWEGPGTVGVVVMDASGHALSELTINGLQTTLDPEPALGAGVAPIDHLVTVMTPALISVAVTAVVTFKSGYSLNGTNNTTSRKADIESALQEYFASLEVGEDVVKDHVLAQFFKVEGVYDVVLSAPAANVAIEGSTIPPQVAVLGTVSLS